MTDFDGDVIEIKDKEGKTKFVDHGGQLIELKDGKEVLVNEKQVADQKEAEKEEEGRQPDSNHKDG